MLNANTATRTFRELQYDIKVFLDALVSLVTTTATASDVYITALWSDGSTDVLPAMQFVKVLVGNIFSNMTIGRAFLIATKVVSNNKSSDGKLVLSITCPGGVGAKISNITSSATQEFNSCTIGSLEADIVSLYDGITIESLTVNGELSIKTMLADAFTASSMTSKNAYASSLDASGLCLECNLYTSIIGLGSSSLLVYATRAYNDKITSVIYLTGPMSVLAEPQANVTTQYANKVYADKIVSGNLVALEIPDYSGYKYVGSASTMVNGMDTTFTPDSNIGMMLIYPKFTFTRLLEMNNDAYSFQYRMVAPTDDDNNTVVTVYNNSHESIQACNAWKSIGRSGYVAELNCNNLIEIPARSRVDFLFTYTSFKSTSTVIYDIQMLPMKYLSNDD